VISCGLILPNLFVGPAPTDDDDFRELKELNITAILSLQTEEDDSAGAIENERNTAIAIGMTFTNLPVTDFDRLELARKLPECVKTVEGLLAHVDTLYLHCTAGVNRSPTVAAAYLHWSLRWPLEKALEHIETCRKCCPDEVAIRHASHMRDRATS
jgi:protein-tyrosine phosphatase